MGLEATAQKKSERELKSEIKAERKKLDVRFKRADTKLKKYHEEGIRFIYPKGTKIEVDASLFGDILNSNESMKHALAGYARTCTQLVMMSDDLINRNQELTIALMEQHVSNIEAGKVTKVTPQKAEENGKK